MATDLKPAEAPGYGNRTDLALCGLKPTGEMYMKSFTRVYGLETVMIRYFNVFGPHQDPTSMYSGTGEVHHSDAPR